MEICPKCKQPIRKRRSNDISTRFHAHVTWLAKAAGISREEVYIRALLKACEIEVDGGTDYPHLIIDDVVRPLRTTNRTNKEMMTACEGVQLLAAEWELGPLPEGRV
jgi:hypothetical protein